MTLFTWRNDKHLLGVAQMDDTHMEFGVLVNQLGETADGTAFKHLFAQLVEHTRLHFAAEDALMVESAFPAIGEHRAEHDRILGQLTQINERVQKGLIVMGREYVADLPGWFDLHGSNVKQLLEVDFVFWPKYSAFPHRSIR